MKEREREREREREKERERKRKREKPRSMHIASWSHHRRSRHLPRFVIVAAVNCR